MSQVLVHTGAAILSADQPLVPVVDHGFLYGDSVYEVIRTANGRPYQLAEHMERMRRSAGIIYFELPWDDDEVARRTGELSAALGVPEIYVRIVATRGPGPISLLPDECDAPVLYLIARDLIRYPERLYREGCSIAVVPRLRNDPRALDPKAKTGNYLNNMLGVIEARRAGCDDALFLNAEGHLTECTTSNVWLVHGGVVTTPPVTEGLLPGITRDWIFGALPAEGIEVREEILPRERLGGAAEVFLSGTVKGIMPATRIDGEPVGDGTPGPITRRLADLYRAALDAN